MDIKYFYIETPMPEYEYFCITFKHIPVSIMKNYQFCEKYLIQSIL